MSKLGHRFVCRGGGAGFYDNEHHLLWSVESHEEWLSLEQQCQRQRANQRQVDERDRLLWDADRIRVHVRGAAGYVYL